MQSAIATLLPRETRMLLESKGSTTVLLESLLDVRIKVRVESQTRVLAADVEPAVGPARQQR